ncbi:MAG TPA: polysaccharide lyase family protein, partial [Opitutales bacterium]|nr:polysaccharide lyase family protein [Opitutales bacterium]
RRLLLSTLLATAVAMPALRAADAAPAADANAPIVISKPKTTYDVTVTDEGRTYMLNNGIVAARINKTSGELLNLYYYGKDVAGHDQGAVGVWEQDPSVAAQSNALTDSVTIDPAKNGGERGEVSIKGVSGGTLTLGPNAPGGGTNFDIEIRYSIGRGDSGVYAYAIFSHPAAYGPGRMGSESRFIFRVNQSFDWISVDKDRNMLAAGPLNWGTGVVVHAKEQRIMSQGPYTNSVEHKYSYNGVQFKIPAYGWSSTSEHIGVWFINPTSEYLSGGATKLELQTHYGDNDDPDPIILDYWKGSHYGQNTFLNVAANEDWSHVVGPIFLYVNSLESFKRPTKAELDTFTASYGNPIIPAAWQDNQTALFQNALDQAKMEKSKWPYDWVNGVDYPHKDQRGSVSGQLVLNDVYAPKGTSTKLPHLTVGLSHPWPSDNDSDAGGHFGSEQSWVRDGTYYQFWENGTEDGKFTIDKVRPGNYTLHAFADGVLGEFARTNITVEAGKSIDLGKLEWKPIRYGTQVFDIGIPDRSAREFLKGDGDNYWLWGWPVRYPLLFPNDLTYTVGKSTPSKDWFFEEVPHGTADPTLFLNPAAKDPANQRFGWVKAQSREEFPTTTGDAGVWRQFGNGRATTWTIKFNMDKASQGYATFRIALAGADGAGGATVGVNGQDVGRVGAMATNALRYNTDQGVWQERDVRFDASLLKPGENQITITVPAGDLDSGLVYDYLRLELNEYYKLDGTPLTPPKS